MFSQPEGKSHLLPYQPDSVGALANQFLTLLATTITESVNHAAQNILSELKQKQHENTNEVADGFLTREETAKLLQISYPTLWRYQQDGTLPFHRVGRSILFNRKDVINATKVTLKKKGAKG